METLCKTLPLRRRCRNTRWATWASCPPGPFRERYQKDCKQTHTLRAQVLNTFYFLVGYLGFLSTWIMDTIFLFVRNATLDWYNRVTSHALRAASPHFVLARGLYDISQVTLTSQWLLVHRLFSDSLITLCEVLSYGGHPDRMYYAGRGPAASDAGVLK